MNPTEKRTESETGEYAAYFAENTDIERDNKSPILGLLRRSPQRFPMDPNEERSIESQAGRENAYVAENTDIGRDNKSSSLDSHYIIGVPGEETTFPCPEVKQSYTVPIATNPSIQSDNNLPTVHDKTLKQEDLLNLTAVPGDEVMMSYADVKHSYAIPIATKIGMESGEDIPTAHFKTIQEHDPSICDGEKVFDCMKPGKEMSKKVKTSFVCAECGETFTQNHNLTTHRCIQSMQKSFECTICGKRCTRMSSLTRHLRSHSGERPYKCAVCGKDFAQGSSLKCHLRTHTVKTPYTCTVCGNDFAHRSSLDRHLRTHSGERPHYCTVCGKGFSRNSSLTNHHLRTHNGASPHRCTLCGKIYAQHSDIKTHIETHIRAHPE